MKAMDMYVLLGVVMLREFRGFVTAMYLYRVTTMVNQSVHFKETVAIGHNHLLMIAIALQLYHSLNIGMGLTKKFRIEKKKSLTLRALNRITVEVCFIRDKTRKEMALPIIPTSAKLPMMPPTKTKLKISHESILPTSTENKLRDRNI